MGTVITFYSYKGGVGRTMALANVATLLAKWGKKVLVVDWDLEAPGVEHFLVDEDSPLFAKVQKRPGLIDLLTSLSASGSSEIPDDAWMQYALETPIRGTNAKLWLLTAGARVQGYYNTVRKLDVKSFYEDKNGGHIIEGLRNGWKSNFDFVLVDSRTGITDIGGICTIQLPDILAIVFTAATQSFEGAVDVARKAALERQKLPFDRSLVPTVPIPSRFDTQTELEISRKWLNRFEHSLSPLFHQWLPEIVKRREFLEVTKVPYTAFFSFGEGLPVVEQGTTDPAGLGYAYETIAALIGNNLQHAELLLTNRDEFIQLARFPGRLPKTSLRDLSLPCVLLIDLVGASAIRSSFERAKTPTRVQEQAFDKFHSIVAFEARSRAGELAMSDGDGFLFAFPDTDSAIKTAISVEEALAVKKPVDTPFGHLRARMAIHAVPTASEANPSIELLLQTATKIIGKAKEGEILASEQARNLASDKLENIRFNKRSEEIELPDFKQEFRLVEIVKVTPIDLTAAERTALFKQNPNSKSGGGFQAFLVGLQERVDERSGRLVLTIKDRERIARYAHDYKGGGWQGRLRKIFGRALGDNLGRETA